MDRVARDFLSNNVVPHIPVFNSGGIKRKSEFNDQSRNDVVHLRSDSQGDKRKAGDEGGVDPKRQRTFTINPDIFTPEEEVAINLLIASPDTQDDTPAVGKTRSSQYKELMRQRAEAGRAARKAAREAAEQEAQIAIFEAANPHLFVAAPQQDEEDEVEEQDFYDRVYEQEDRPRVETKKSRIDPNSSDAISNAVDEVVDELMDQDNGDDGEDDSHLPYPGYVHPLASLPKAAPWSGSVGGTGAFSHINQRGANYWRQHAFDQIQEQKRARAKAEKIAKAKAAQAAAQAVFRNSAAVQRTMRQNQIKATMTPDELARFNELQKKIKHKRDVLVSYNKHLRFTNNTAAQVDYQWFERQHALVRRHYRKRLRDLWIEMANPTAAERAGGYTPLAMSLWYQRHGESWEEELNDTHLLFDTEIDEYIRGLRNRISNFRSGILASVPDLFGHLFPPRNN